MDVDVVILTDDVKVQEAGLCPQLLQLLTEDPAVVLDHDAQGTMNKSLVTALAPELELEVVRIFLQSDTDALPLRKRGCDEMIMADNSCHDLYGQTNAKY